MPLMTFDAQNPKLRPGIGAHVDRPGPAIVLVEPQLGENIGAVARVMLNFGLTDLRLVAPRDGWPNEKAVAMASGAARVVENARVVASTAEALGPAQFVAAMTARPRESLMQVMTPEEAARAMRARLDRGEKCALLLGPERTGLSNDDVARADVIVSIPVNPAFASLNLAQAACVFAYEWAKADGYAPPPSDLETAAPATREEFDGLVEHLFAELDRQRYFYPEEKRPIQQRKIRTALSRASLTEGEVRTLRGVIKALVDRRPKD
ncbi:MAG: RNA methyltransferase [Parvularculaceae bacterium]|nr:RNA methyltransferase [Parvularculaceae bacterium]